MAIADTTILDQAGINRALTRIAHEILEHNKGCRNLALIGIRTGGDHLASLLRARIRDIDAACVRADLEAGRVVVVAGFQGVDEHGNITTLGRGGSDTTAVAMAAAAHALRAL